MYEKFMAYADRATLSLLLSINEPSGRLVRWLRRLTRFEFEATYKKGKASVHVVALSRL